MVQYHQLSMIFGGMNKGRPEEQDLELAVIFAEERTANVNESPYTFKIWVCKRVEIIKAGIIRCFDELGQNCDFDSA